MVRSGAWDASQDDTMTLPALGSSAVNASHPPAASAWSGPADAPPPDDDTYAALFRPAPGEPSPHTMTRVIPAVDATAHVPATPQPAYGQQQGYGPPTGAGHAGQPYPAPYQSGSYQDDYYDGSPRRRGNVGVAVAVGVAVVAIAVIIGSVSTLSDHKQTPAAQTPDPTQVVMPADTGTSATIQAAPVPTQTDSPTTGSPSPTTQASALTGPIIGAGSSRCVDIPGANAADGSQLDLFDCNGTNAQAWTYNTDGTVQAMGKCLDVRGADSDDRTPVQVFSCNGTAAQQWSYDPQTGELKTLGKCLDASGAATGNGTPLILYSCHGGPNQQWHLTPRA